MTLWMIWFCLNILFSRPQPITYRKPKSKPGFKSRRKPRWVDNRIIEHKAIMNKDGCRKIAASFNRRFGDKETVSKSWVATIVRKHQYEILQLRKKLKNRLPNLNQSIKPGALIYRENKIMIKTPITYSVSLITAQGLA